MDFFTNPIIDLGAKALGVAAAIAAILFLLSLFKPNPEEDSDKDTDYAMGCFVVGFIGCVIFAVCLYIATEGKGL